MTHPVDAVHYEAELSLIVENNQFIGAGIGLDLTKREVQSVLKGKGLPWERAKAFDQSAVFSAFTRIDNNVETLRLVLLINDQVIQQANYDLMIYKPAEIVKDVSEFMSFENNDVLMTGTPKGVGKINVGDIFVGNLYDQDKLLLTQTWTVK